MSVATNHITSAISALKVIWTITPEPQGLTRMDHGFTCPWQVHSFSLSLSLDFDGSQAAAVLTTLWTRQRLARQRAGARRIKAAEDLAAEPLEVLELLVSAPEDSTAVRLEPRPAAAHAKPGLPSGRRPIKTMSPSKPNTTNGHHNGHHKWTTNRKKWQTFARTGKTCQAGKASKLAMALLLEAFARATRSFMFPNAVCKTNLVLPTLEIKDPK